MGLFDKFKKLFNTKDNETTNEIREEKKDVQIYEEGLEKTRKVFKNQLNLLNTRHKVVSEEYFEDLEEILISADIGVETVMKFIDRLKQRVKKENIMLADLDGHRPEEIEFCLTEAQKEMFKEVLKVNKNIF